MNRKIRVAAIYKKSFNFLSGNHFDNTYYHFFIDALQRNKKIEVDYFPAENSFDTSKLKGKYDVILLANNNIDGTPNELVGIKNVGIPVISKMGDPQNAKKFNQFQFHEKFNIDYYFNFLHKDYFYKFYPKSYSYKTIIWGLEPALNQNFTPFKDRIKNKILNSGATGNTKIFSRVINSIINHNSNSYNQYKLRTLCNKLPYVDYTQTLQHEFIGDKYPQLLQKYSASIAASTTTPTRKYLEIPAAGCLTFMEVTEKNRGKYLQFKDDENVIFINEKNYKKKFCEYLDDPENKKWQEIAKRGQYHAKNNLSNDKGVDLLVDLIKEII